MKITIEEIVNKYRNMASPLIGLLSSNEVDEEVVRIHYSDNNRSLVIRKSEYVPVAGYESIWIPFNNEVNIDIDGSFIFTYNDEQFNVLIMVPLISKSTD